MIPTLLSPDRLKACFAADYTEAHIKFRHACDRHDHSAYREFVYREKGPTNEKLFSSVYWLGNPNAKRVLVLQSATHGVEGFAGSAIQIDCLDDFLESKLDDDLAILFIHALNPYGFAWLRRVNENGIDLNRNFVDFNAPLPDNTAYAELAELLLPGSEKNINEADRKLQLARQQLGQVAFEQAVSGGQYAFADGLFYGGQAASQSQLYLQQIITDFELLKREYVAVVDIHTGLGPFGYGELICDHPPESKGVQWAKQVYGQSVTEPALGSSSSVPKDGLVDYYWQNCLADKLCFITLEFGTYPVEQMFDILRLDHMLHRHTVNWRDSHVQKIKRQLRQHFYPATADWQEMVLLRGRQIIRQALQGLSA
ncbi:MAG: M14 family metallopeptidase [Gammaproteobacteria bacterium]|nr:M14 family metallopeptidase [Gammaproteobacteria bacterium]